MMVPSPLGDELRPTAELLTEFYAFQQAQKEMRERKVADAPTGALARCGAIATDGRPARPQGQRPCRVPHGCAAKAPPRPAQPAPINGAPPMKPVPPLPQQVFLAEAKARFRRHRPCSAHRLRRAARHVLGEPFRRLGGERDPMCASSPAPSSGKRIRPHVFGRFADMLLAVETHPAMLFYLDNQQSFGPNSLAGQNRKRGLNENLAREILELHTLGVNGGYTQEDVTSLARIITGWTVGGPRGPPRRAGDLRVLRQRA